MRLSTAALIASLAWLPSCEAAWRGKLDLTETLPSPLGIRELHDGNWLAGQEKRLWYLEEDGKERLSLSFFTAWRAFQGDPAYGPSLGLNTGKLGEAVEKALRLVVPELADKAKFMTQLSNWVSLEAYVGYRPVHGPDTHDLIYGIGGKVKIPLDLLKGL